MKILQDSKYVQCLWQFVQIQWSVKKGHGNESSSFIWNHPLLTHKLEYYAWSAAPNLAHLIFKCPSFLCHVVNNYMVVLIERGKESGYFANISLMVSSHWPIPSLTQTKTHWLRHLDNRISGSRYWSVRQVQPVQMNHKSEMITLLGHRHRKRPWPSTRWSYEY